MSKYKIGVTEAGDAGLDLSWEAKLPTTDGAILITKNLTAGFQEAVLRNTGKVIVHATCTGFGGTAVEPNVPLPKQQLASACKLVADGFPASMVVIRIDPVIPTDRGLARAESVFFDALHLGFSRFRLSVLDMYPHVRERFAKAGLRDPYNGSFLPTADALRRVGELTRRVAEYGKAKGVEGLRIEACAEPGLNSGVIQCGCVSSYDLELLGLEPDTDSDGVGYQRKNCLCYAGKTELLTHKSRCPHGCLYCYWR